MASLLPPYLELATALADHAHGLLAGSLLRGYPDSIYATHDIVVRALTLRANQGHDPIGYGAIGRVDEDTLTDLFLQELRNRDVRVERIDSEEAPFKLRRRFVFRVRPAALERA